MLKLSELSGLLDRLDGEPADTLESETLEFKSWDSRRQQRKTQIRSLRETVVAFAQRKGAVSSYLVWRTASGPGLTPSRASAISPQPVSVTISMTVTEPHILVEIDELQEPEGRLLVVRVPRGLPPHTTTDGVARIRIGKDSKPLTGSTLAQLFMTRSGRDFTADPVPGVPFRGPGSGADGADCANPSPPTASVGTWPTLGIEICLKRLASSPTWTITLAAVLLLGNRPTPGQTRATTRADIHTTAECHTVRRSPGSARPVPRSAR